ncbi:MAG: hypothetical protein MUE69_24005 [Myxococcota bacterium]|nr:hypothetical protein [Myxococcota bacterium]
MREQLHRLDRGRTRRAHRALVARVEHDAAVVGLRDERALHDRDERPRRLELRDPDRAALQQHVQLTDRGAFGPERRRIEQRELAAHVGLIQEAPELAPPRRARVAAEAQREQLSGSGLDARLAGRVREPRFADREVSTRFLRARLGTPELRVGEQDLRGVAGRTEENLAEPGRERDVVGLAPGVHGVLVREGVDRTRTTDRVAHDRELRERREQRRQRTRVHRPARPRATGGEQAQRRGPRVGVGNDRALRERVEQLRQDRFDPRRELAQRALVEPHRGARGVRGKALSVDVDTDRQAPAGRRESRHLHHELLQHRASLRDVEGDAELRARLRRDRDETLEARAER